MGYPSYTGFVQSLNERLQLNNNFNSMEVEWSSPLTEKHFKLKTNYSELLFSTIFYGINSHLLIHRIAMDSTKLWEIT